jgi:hypothetical protein
MDLSLEKSGASLATVCATPTGCPATGANSGSKAAVPYLVALTAESQDATGRDKTAKKIARIPCVENAFQAANYGTVDCFKGSFLWYFRRR